MSDPTMGADPIQKSGGFFWPILLFLTLGVGGAMVYQGRLTSSRPTTERGVSTRLSGRVEAHLWEDPLDVVRAATEAIIVRANESLKADPSDEDSNQIKSQLLSWQLYTSIRRAVDQPADNDKLPDGDSDGVRILLVPLRDGKSAEDKEWRIRARFALVKSLHANGYHAPDPEHIRYGFLLDDFDQKFKRYRKFLLHDIEEEEYEGLGNTNVWQSQTEEKSRGDFSAAIPFEWFSYDSLRPNPENGSLRKRVCIIWIPDSLMQKNALAAVAALVDTILGYPQGYDPDAGESAGEAEAADGTGEETSRPFFQISYQQPVVGQNGLPWRIPQENKSDRSLFDQGKSGHGGNVRIDLLGPSSSGALRSTINDAGLLKEASQQRPEIKKEIEELNVKIEELERELWPAPLPPAEEAAAANRLRTKFAFPASFTSSRKNEDNPYEQYDELRKKLKSRTRELESTQQFLQAISGIKIYSPYSTVEPNLFTSIDLKCDDHQRHRKRNLVDAEEIELEFVRTIGTDGALAGELISELQRRGVRTPDEDGKNFDHIALIGEEETFYGRAFRITFGAAYRAITAGESPTNLDESFFEGLSAIRNEDEMPKAIKTYGFIRGVDGFVPTNQSPQKGETSNIKSNSIEKPELPVGKGQLDYIRRLAHQIEEDYNRSGVRPEAIGIVGSDVYDKLLLLQALRPHFPNAIFFTTDLDARLFHFDEYKWTRNLLVASHYGLSLNDEFLVFGGDGSPIFRDNYQTAIYLAGCVALSQRQGPRSTSSVSKSEFVRSLLSHPRLFEIGRETAVDITVYKGDVSVHPKRPGPLPFIQRSHVIGIITASLFAAFLVYHASSYVRRTTHYFASSNSGRWAFVGGIVALIAVYSIGIYDHQRYTGEPFSFSQGISIWPSVLMRTLALFLCIAFIAKARHDLHAKAKELQRDYHLPKLPTAILGTSPSPFNLIAWIRYRSKISIENWKRSTPVDANQIWKEYKEFANDRNRWSRVISMTFTYLVFCGALRFIWDFPAAPYRGDLAKHCDLVIGSLSFIALVTLTFYIVDATRLSKQFVQHLAAGSTRWSAKTRSISAATNRKLNRYELAEWLDLKIVAEWTRTVSQLITYPFIILLIMTIGRSTYFDNWIWTIPVLIIYILILLYAISCAVMLRKQVERLRLKSIERMRKNLLRVQSSASQNLERAEQLKVLIEDAINLRRGAFAPLGENPILAAILIPSSGFTLMALWDVWSMVS